MQVGAGELGLSAKCWAGVAAGVTHPPCLPASLLPSLAVFTLAVHLFGFAFSSPKPEETRRSLQKEPPGKRTLGGEGFGGLSVRQHGIHRDLNTVIIVEVDGVRVDSS